MKVLGVDYIDNTKRTAYADGEGGVVFKHETNFAPIIEENKRTYNQVDERARWGEGQLVANIPFEMINWLNQQGILRGFEVLDQKRMKEWLNSSDNQYFRTRPGRV